MAREIKFRAWDLLNERMVYEPYLFEPCPTHRENTIGASFRFYETWRDYEDGVDRLCHIMQYVGVKDTQGNELYEGDIIQLPGSNYYARIVWVPVGFQIRVIQYDLRNQFYHLQNWLDKGAVKIGDIYSTPELLKAGEKEKAL